MRPKQMTRLLGRMPFVKLFSATRPLANFVANCPWSTLPEVNVEMIQSLIILNVVLKVPRLTRPSLPSRSAFEL